MKSHGWRLAAAIALAAPACATAGEPADGPKLSGSVNALWYSMRDQPDFGVGVASLNRGALHLELRQNYEAKGATSTFAGWKFQGGDGVTWEATPLAGVLAGSTHAWIAGLEASVAYKAFDAYVEAEYVLPHAGEGDRYTYAWSELGWRPAENLRVGIVGQRTRVIASERSLQRGVFAQFAMGRATLGVFAFNPDDAARYVIVSLGLGF